MADGRTRHGLKNTRMNVGGPGPIRTRLGGIKDVVAMGALLSFLVYWMKQEKRYT
jgi:hypothetical protein